MTGGIDPAPLTSAAISDYAERVGNHHGIYNEAGHADVLLLAERLGGRIATSDSLESLYVAGVSDFTIYLPVLTSERRDRFTVAHELGHYFLHYRLPKITEPQTFGRGEQNSIETQANVFASALLMPSTRFRKSHEALAGDSYALAKEFGVSVAAAEVRRQVLGLT